MFKQNSQPSAVFTKSHVIYMVKYSGEKLIDEKINLT